ncbi:MAG: aryl-sulfate sulfotransferase [Candidatus Kapabacteria bacterium]|nr:aryl-sulfate sulfotransferase [Candidatus Kapabacteria bacterium]
MKDRFSTRLIVIILFCFLSVSTLKSGDFVEFDVSVLDNPAPGYILTGPFNDHYLTIYDNSGKVAYYRDLAGITEQVMALRLLENGYIAFFAETRWIICDENLNIVKYVSCSPQYITNFHTLFLSPQGNYLLVANDFRKIDMSRIVQGGKTDATLENHIIQEFDRNGNLVFEWNCLEHINITDAAEGIPLTESNVDPYHVNCVRYDTDGNILANFRNLDAFYKINRQTGDIMWIMGGKASKVNQFTFVNDNINGFWGFSRQHDPKRLSNGNILLFDNGNARPQHFARAVEYSINETTKRATKVWEYIHYPYINSAFMGSAQRLPNGNTLIGWGMNLTTNFDYVATEVTPDGKKVFEIKLPNHRAVYQVLREVFKMIAASNDINSPGTYVFTDGIKSTGISLQLSSVSGGGYTSVEKHYYSPHNITYSGQQACIVLPYRWVINSHNISYANGKISFDLTQLENLSDYNNIKIFHRPKEGSGNFNILETTYNTQRNTLEANISQFGEFMLGFTILSPPTIKSPANNSQNVSLSPIIKWQAGSQFEKYRIQIALDQNFNEILIDSSNISTTEYRARSLKNFTTYYYRLQKYSFNCHSEWTETQSFTTTIATPEQIFPKNLSKNEPLDGVMEWIAVPGAEKYKIQICEFPTFNIFVFERIVDSVNKFDYFFSKPLTKYYWRIAAIRGNYITDWSEVWSYTTSNGIVKLSEPSKFFNKANIKQRFDWYAINSANYYQFQLAKDFNFEEIIIDTNKLKLSEITITKLENSTTYFWRVRAFFRDTSTAWSEKWMFSTLPATPQLLVPANNTQHFPVNGVLQWSIVPKATNYIVQIAYGNDFNQLVKEENTTTNYFSLFNLDFNTQYFWRVKALSKDIESQWSEIRSFATIEELLYPKFDEFKVPLDVKFNWNKTVGFNFYDLKISEDYDFSKNTIFYTNIKDTTFLVNNLKPNQTYYWTVRANTNNKSKWADVFQFTTQLANPELIEPFNNEILVPNKLIFKWNKVDGATYYNLVVSRDYLQKDILHNLTNLKENQVSLQQLFSNGDFYWSVTAFNEKNSSLSSNVQKFTINSSYLSLIVPNGGEVWIKDSEPKRIQWDKKINSNVKISLYRNGEYFRTIADTVGANFDVFNWVIPSDIPDDSTYQVKVTSLNNPEVFSLSRKPFSIRSITSVDDHKEEIKFSIMNYPNPLNNTTYFDILLDKSTHCSIEIYDINGLKISELLNARLNSGKHTFMWDASDFPTGVYYYLIKINGDIQRGTLTVIK